MAAHGVKTLIYSSTCATYGEPEKMPITEATPQVCSRQFGLSWIVISHGMLFQNELAKYACSTNDICSGKQLITLVNKLLSTLM